jgi:hypothetical protein
MSDKRIKIPLELTEDQAWALAALVKRFRHDHAKSLSSEFTKYGDEAEHDVMMDAVCVLGRALDSKGVSPR